MAFNQRQLRALQQMMMTQTNHEDDGLLSFRAGQSFMDEHTKMVTADPKRGKIKFIKDDAGVLHLEWLNRISHQKELDLMIFPHSATWQKVKECTDGRVYLLRMLDSNKKHFFWMQEPNDEKDDLYATQINKLCNGQSIGVDDNVSQNNTESMNPNTTSLTTSAHNTGQDAMAQLLLNAMQTQSAQIQSQHTQQTQQLQQLEQSDSVTETDESNDDNNETNQQNEDDLHTDLHDGNHNEEKQDEEDEDEEEEEEEEDILMDEIMNDSMTSLSTEQYDKLRQDGYCMVDDPLRQREIAFAVSGFVREHYDGSQMEKYLLREIVYFYGSRFNTKLFIELVVNQPNRQYFLVPRRNLRLSEMLNKQMEEHSESNKIELDEEKVNSESMHHVLRYLGHHRGREPAPLPCPVRSIHMRQIVTDPWDAPFIDVFSKKQVFEIILIAHHLAITPLTHLGCAKIATLIKQLDQTEINRIIDEEERYRREHAQTNDDDEDENKDDNEDEDDNDDQDADEEQQSNDRDEVQDPGMDVLDGQ